jgi:hypothetical protein
MMIGRIALIALAVSLAACTEKPQELHPLGALDKPAYVGSGSKFVVTDWKQGDRGSWEQELRVRGQRGQNEYNKTSRTQ